MSCPIFCGYDNTNRACKYLKYMSHIYRHKFDSMAILIDVIGNLSLCLEIDKPVDCKCFIWHEQSNYNIHSCN